MTRPDAALIGALERSNIHPLWDRYKRITPVAPGAKDAPMHWRWRDLEPFTERASRVSEASFGNASVDEPFTVRVEIFWSRATTANSAWIEPLTVSSEVSAARSLAVS